MFEVSFFVCDIKKKLFSADLLFLQQNDMLIKLDFEIEGLLISLGLENRGAFSGVGNDPYLSPNNNTAQQSWLHPHRTAWHYKILDEHNLIYASIEII
jgi:hypothetical protein